MDKEFTIQVKIKDRWVNQFISFLKRMEFNGVIGHSELLSFYSDGDGDCRPKFEFKGVYYVEEPPCKCDKDVIENNPIIVTEFYDAG